MKFARLFSAVRPLVLVCACGHPAAPPPPGPAPTPVDAQAATPPPLARDAAPPAADPQDAAIVGGQSPTDASAASDGPPATPRGKPWSCPAGPFPAPKAGATQPVCGSLALKYNWNEGPTWIASQNAFFFSNFTEGAGIDGDMIKYTPASGQCEIFIA